MTLGQPIPGQPDFPNLCPACGHLPGATSACRTCTETRQAGAAAIITPPCPRCAGPLVPTIQYCPACRGTVDGSFLKLDPPVYVPTEQEEGRWHFARWLVAEGRLVG